MMRIAVLGGSFDPPHLGHFWVTRQILEQRSDIEKILLMPALQHQWKPIIASSQHRVAMLASLTSEKIAVSDIELKRKGVSYTLDTVKELKEQANNELFWIVGSDILGELDRWEKSEGMLTYAKFLVFPRDPYLLPDVLPEGFEAIRSESLITSNISSTAIRRRIAEGKSIHNFVPKEVEAYVSQHALYK